MLKPDRDKYYCLQNCCIELAKFLPVIFLGLIIGWSYYAYVIALNVYTVQSTTERVIYLIIYHPVLIIFLWCYGVAIFTPPKHPPSEFYLSPQECERFLQFENANEQNNFLLEIIHCRHLSVQTRGINDLIRFCRICMAIKPDRAHHCSTCNCCLLKMDHHCPWVNNCVGFHNYKYFVIFLGHGCVYCLYIAATTLKYFIDFWVNTARGMTLEFLKDAKNSSSYQDPVGNVPLFRFNILFLFFVAIMFAICLLCLFGYHIWLTMKNRTTLESFRAPIFTSGPNKDGFNLGKSQNFKAVFGYKPHLWFIPIFTSRGDGINWDLNVPTPPNYHTMESGSPS